MEKKILYHIGLYGFRKLIVYVIKDNGDNTSIVSLNKDGSFPKHVWNCNLHNIKQLDILHQSKSLKQGKKASKQEAAKDRQTR